MKTSETDSTPDETKAQDKLAPFVEQAVLNVIRQQPLIHFTADSITDTHYENGWASWLGLPSDHKFQIRSIMAAIKNSKKTYGSFEVKINYTEEYNWKKFEIKIDIKPDFDWSEAVEEAWKHATNPSPHNLTDNSVRLLNWIRSDKFQPGSLSRRSIGARTKFRGSHYDIPKHLQEIRIKADPTLRFEFERNSDVIKIWRSQEEAKLYDIGPLNPQLELDPELITYQELERFRVWFYEFVEKAEFSTEDASVGVFDIRCRKTLLTGFRGLHKKLSGYDLAEFFSNLRLLETLQLSWNFEWDSNIWLLVCRPRTGYGWKQIKAQLRALAAEVSPEKKYGLSKEAAALFKWISKLQPEEMLSGMTPMVEEHLAVDIGIAIEWDEENLRAYIELLVEEINEKTEYELRTQPWKQHNEVLTRIRVKKKRSDIEELVRQIQIYALGNNQLLAAGVVRESIEKLVKT